MKNEDKKGYKSATWRRNTAYISPLAAMLRKHSREGCRHEKKV